MAQAVLARRLRIGYAKLQLKGDARIGAMGELIDNIKMVKYYAWEASIMKAIEQQRLEELKAIWRMRAVLEPAFLFLGALPQVITGVLFLMWAVADGGEFTVASAFVSITVL
eukprot:5486956-Amphidinium_carterae.1